jgi:pantoate--beta-alanine ligase
MQLFHTIHEWMEFRRTLNPSHSIGFAPTMGNLHLGHMSLFHQSKQENDYTVTSLFINPTQFNNPEDFTNYPRTLDEDLDKLREAGVDFCLLPNFEEIYPDNYTYQVEEHSHSLLLEGAQRPGHFTGVLTIVMKLLQLVKPTRAYFGEKDHQQYTLIKGMADAFFMNIEIIACPTIRNPNGLAHSSRNNRLTPLDLNKAERFAQIFHQETTIDSIEAQLHSEEIQIEYLEELNNRLYIAVTIGGIRLIDNRSTF